MQCPYLELEFMVKTVVVISFVRDMSVAVCLAVSEMIPIKSKLTVVQTVQVSVLSVAVTSTIIPRDSLRICRMRLVSYFGIVV